MGYFPWWDWHNIVYGELEWSGVEGCDVVYILGGKEGE